MGKLVFFLLLMLLIRPGQSEQPSVDSIDYQRPEKYLQIAGSLGDEKQIAKLASSLKRSTAEKTIASVLDWMGRNLGYDAEVCYSWRNFDTVYQEKKYGGCADQGIFCGVVLKAAGIPVVWVKTMDVDWIWDFKKKRPFSAWSGHVFLEVFVDGKWMLLNPGSRMLHRQYATEASILPGNRFAYHKGNDPYEMIMSLQWKEWKTQTRDYFESLPESVLPVDEPGGISLAMNQAFVAGNSPYYQVLTRVAQKEGCTVRRSFNIDYEKHLNEAKGHFILIETHDGVPVVPADILESVFPGVSKLREAGNETVEVDATRILFYDFLKPLK